MDFENGMILAPMIMAALGLAFSLYCFKNLRKAHELIVFAENQIEELQNTLARNKVTFDANALRLAEQSSRLAWVEHRVRQSKPTAEDAPQEAIHETPKLNITERRHLVMSLAQRGQDVDAISGTLGMLRGEVELIINLTEMASQHK